MSTLAARMEGEKNIQQVLYTHSTYICRHRNVCCVQYVCACTCAKPTTSVILRMHIRSDSSAMTTATPSVEPGKGEEAVATETEAEAEAEGWTATPKDLVVIGFVLCLWLYSVVLMFR